MAEHVIRLPDVGEGIAEAELVEWHVKVGDLVREDTTLAAVMTDKATVEIPSPVDGEIIWLGAEIGDKVAVGSDLVRLKIRRRTGRGERSAAATTLRGRRSAEPAPAAKPRAADSEDRGTTPAMSPKPAPRPAQPAEPRPAPARQWRRAGRRSSRSRRRRCVCARERRASTCVRYRGTGPAGRITHEDLDAFAAPRSSRGAIAGASAEDRGRRRQGGRPAAQDRREDGGGARAHPAYHLCRRGRCHGAGRACGQTLNRRKRKEQPKLTLLPFLMRAMVSAIAKQPRLNALFDDEAGVIHQHAGVHIGIAAQTPAGLMVPVVRHAEALDLWDCAAEVARLAEAAQHRHRDARGTVRFDHHDHVARRHGRRGHDADHQSSRGGDRRRQQDHDAPGLGRLRLHPAQDDEPVVELRSSRHRRLGRGDLRAAHQGAAGDAGADLRERLTPCRTYPASFW